jgi:rfaE bifunctional protein nucleotidyltransferase chain/domain
VVQLRDMEADPLDLTQLRTVPLAERVSKVRLEQFARPAGAGRPAAWLETLPRLLAGNDLRELIEALVMARAARKPVIAAIGAHVVKCGLTPVLLDLIDRGVITAIATNGATVVHDVEIALVGHTSEDVAQGLREGTFGMAEETHRFANEAIREGVAAGLGLGASIGRALHVAAAPHAEASLFAGAHRRGVPVTVHVAVGTDVLHMHATADGASIGEGSLRDFRALSASMAALGGGGVLLNIGSAVILPEVILKAFGILRNLGRDLSGFVSADLDFVRHYRGSRQVVERVHELGGRGLALTGHHEIMLPLIAALVADRLEGRDQHGDHPLARVPERRRDHEGPDKAGAEGRPGRAERLRSKLPLPASKRLESGGVAGVMEAYRAEGRRIVLTNGCFDLLHVGHTRYLEKARALGDLLVVGVNTDASVRRLKGADRPLVPESERAELVAALACVDHVTLFEEDTPEALIAVVRPYRHVKGGDYQAADLPETRLVRELGGEVVILPFTEGRSTTALIQNVARSLDDGHSPRRQGDAER